MSKILKRIIITLVLVIGCTVIVVNGAMAAKKTTKGGRDGSPVSEEANSSVVMKAALRGAENCIDGYHAFSTSFEVRGDGDGAGYIGVMKVGDEGNGSVDAVKLPWGWGDVSNDKKINRMNCRELMDGNGGDTYLAKGMIPREVKRGDFETVAEYFAGYEKNGNGGLGYSAEQVYGEVLAHSEKLIMSIPGDLTDAEKQACDGEGHMLIPVLKSSIDGSTGSGGTLKDKDRQIFETSQIVFPRAFVDINGDIQLDSTNSDGLGTPNVPLTDDGKPFYFRSNCGNIQFKIAKVKNKSEWHITVGNLDAGGSKTYYVVEAEKVADTGAVYRNYKSGSGWGKTERNITSSWSGGYEVINSGRTMKAYAITLNENSGHAATDSVEDSRYPEAYKLTRGSTYDILRGLNERNGVNLTIMDWDPKSGIFNLQLTDQEIFDLYRYYIQNVLKVEVFCKGDAGYDYKAYTNDPVIQWNKCGECKAYVTKNARNYDNGLGEVFQADWLRTNVGNLYGVNLSNRYFEKTITTNDNDGVNRNAVNEVINVLNSLDMNNITVDDTCPGDPTAGGGGGSGTVIPGSASYDDKIVDCNRFNDLGAMQWVMCPAMNNAQYTANAVDNQVDQMLVIDADTYDSNSGAKMAWDIIRNIANVLIIVFFLVVIFSQVTGYGIDNYGIKKMLPRLIVMAIVVNLSFYICELAIDLSNILGVGFRDMFASIATNLNVDTGSVNGTDGLSYIGSMITSAFAAGANLGTGIAAGTAIFSLTGSVAIAIVIAAFIALLVIIVAVFTIYLMLGIRKIIVIVCIMLAPLAFAAYILPNTQNLFKKWWELFKAALVIFPICGAFFGISYLLKAVATNNSGSLGIAGSLVMMILPYAGFFLIPMLLKNAIAALGKIGGALTSLGSTISSSAKSTAGAAWKTAQGTEAFKDMQQEANRRRQQSRVDRIINRLGNKNPDKLSERNQRRLLDAQQTKLKLDTEQEMAKQGMVVPDREAVVARVQSARDAQRLKNYEDQYRYQERSYIEGQLGSAAKAYGDDRSEENRLWLQAAYNEAERRNMDKEIWNDDNNFTSLEFSTGNEQDRRFLEALGGSNDVVRSQFGKQMPNLGDEGKMSLNSFVDGGGAISLKNALDKKGPDSFNTASDDTINYLNRRSEKLGHNVISADNLIHTGAATTDGKVQTQLNNMLSRVDANDIAANGGINGSRLVRQDDANLGTLVDKATAAGGEALKAQLQSAINDINNSPELRAGLTEKQKAQFARVTGGGVPAGGGISAAAAPAQAPRVPAPAPRAQSTGSKPFMTGEGLTKLSTDGLRSFANAAMNDGEGSKNYNDFMTASNEVASRPELMTNLSSEQRQIIHDVRSRFNSNDTKFGGGPQAPNVPRA